MQRLVKECNIRDLPLTIKRYTGSLQQVHIHRNTICYEDQISLFALCVTILTKSSASAVAFTLRNTSVKSVRLQIPGVMNPTLSPMSNSGVDLAVGQEIFFPYKGKRYLLLVVTDELESEVLKVPQLIRQRKKELGL